jgi:hypothetical protein
MTGIVFTADNGIVSRAVRWFTGVQASHVALTAKIGGVDVLIHATVGGVQVSPRRKWLRGERVVAEFKPRAEPVFDLHTAVQSLGERYDYVGLIGYIPVLLARRFGARLRNPLASARATVCSEFALRAAWALGKLRGVSALDPERSTPRDVLKLCLEDNKSLIKTG